jgi:hypothetical protein
MSYRTWLYLKAYEGNASKLCQEAAQSARILPVSIYHHYFDFFHGRTGNVLPYVFKCSFDTSITNIWRVSTPSAKNKPEFFFRGSRWTLNHAVLTL